MPKASSALRLTIATASAAAMLAACGSLPAPRPATDPAATDPVVITQTQTVKVCPAELDQAVPDQPTPAADARVSYNPSGQDYLARLVAWGQGLAKVIVDAAADCHAKASPAQ